MKIAAICLHCFLALCLIGAAPCFSQEKRMAEIKAHLTASNGNNAHAPLIEQSITSYKTQFSETTKSLEAILKSASGDDIEEEWKKVANKQAGYAKKLFEDFVEKADGNSELITAFNKIANQEGKFWSQVAGSGIPIWAGEIDVLTNNLINKTNSLNQSWNIILSKDQEADNKAAQQLKEVEEAKKEYEKTASAQQKAVDALQKFTKRLESFLWDLERNYANAPPGSPSPKPTGDPELDGSLWSLLKTAVKNYDVIVASYIYSKEKIKHAAYGEEYVIRIYKDTRKEAQQFIEKNGYDIAKKYYSDLESSVGTLKSAVNTSGQKDEIEAMKGPIMSAAGDKLRKAEDAYRRFVDENKERFMSALSASSKVVETLLETSNRSKFLADSKVKDLDEELKAQLSDIGSIESKFEKLTNSKQLDPAQKRKYEEILYQFVKAHKQFNKAPLGKEIELVNSYHEKLLDELLD